MKTRLRLALLGTSWLVCILIGYICRGSTPVSVPLYAGTPLAVLDGVPQLPKGFSGTLKEDYPDGRTKSIQVIGDGVGTCTVNFEPDGRIGKLQTSAVLPSGLLIIKTIEWRDGSVAWEGSMAFDKENRKTVLVGVHRGWHTNGACAFEKTLNSYGQEIKTTRTWFPNGQLHLEHVFDDKGGLLVARKWDESGKLQHEASGDQIPAINATVVDKDGKSIVPGQYYWERNTDRILEVKRKADGKL